MEPTTHKRINSGLCGEPVELRPGYSLVRLTTTLEMRVDAADLVHGGFVFGLADYAAMLAVDHPNVVLGSANVRFLKPVKVGEELIARAIVRSPGTDSSKKMLADVTVERADETVLTGEFTCFVLDQHVLA